jgi:hypothetical protein
VVNEFLFCLAMSDSGSKRPLDGSSEAANPDDPLPDIPPDIPPDAAHDSGKKRGRGPEDCLDWSESEEEEFTPFTQTPEPSSNDKPKLVFAKKSVVKSSCKKVAAKKPRLKTSGSKKGNAD